MDVYKKNKFNQASFTQDAFLLEPIQSLFNQTKRASESNQFIVGLSGGADSAMLLVYASLVAPTCGKQIVALHIHHGMQAAADAWVEQCQALCDLLGVTLYIKYVRVANDTGLGEEASAREARYQAYAKFAHEVNCHQYLLAHHQNDQAETVLLRLLRGAGPNGMGAMTFASEQNGMQFYRPWLDVPRARILAAAQAFAQVTAWHAVQDSTNHNIKYTRVAVRELLVPVLDKRWPSWQANVSRHAQLMQENSLLLKDLAEIDLLGLELSKEGNSFSLAAWRQLAEHRQANVLRYWLSTLGLQVPSQARLNEWMRQLRSVHQMGTDRNLVFKHQSTLIYLRKGRVGVDV